MAEPLIAREASGQTDSGLTGYPHHLSEWHSLGVAVGICSPSVIPRDFPAVTLPAIIAIALTFWAIRQAHGEGAKAA
jgi:hypothetical protein